MYTFVRNSYLIIILERLRPNQKPNGVCLRSLRREGPRLQGKEKAHVGARRGQTTRAAANCTATEAAPGAEGPPKLRNVQEEPSTLERPVTQLRFRRIWKQL